MSDTDKKEALVGLYLLDVCLVMFLAVWLQPDQFGLVWWMLLIAGITNIFMAITTALELTFGEKRR